MTLADTLIYHSAAMVNMLNEPQSPTASSAFATAADPTHRTTKASTLLDILPSEFSTAEAVMVAKDLGIPERTLRDRLNLAVKEKAIKRTTRGKYCKL